MSVRRRRGTPECFRYARPQNTQRVWAFRNEPNVQKSHDSIGTYGGWPEPSRQFAKNPFFVLVVANTSDESLRQLVYVLQFNF